MQIYRGRRCCCGVCREYNYLRVTREVVPATGGGWLKEMGVLIFLCCEKTTYYAFVISRIKYNGEKVD